MSQNSYLKDELVKKSPEYRWFSRIVLWFLFSMIGIIFAFLQYFGIWTGAGWPHWIRTTLFYWMKAAPFTLLLVSFFYYLNRANVPYILDLICGDKYSSMPEKESFDLHIDPNANALKKQNKDVYTASSAVRDSLIYAIIAITTLFVQYKNDVYAVMGPNFSEEFLNKTKSFWSNLESIL